jgi:uncharacterized OB-fold protein
MSGAVPTPTPETLPYWEGTARETLQVQRCKPCAEYYFYPRPFCPRCGSEEVEWRIVSGRAKLVSFIINQRPLPPFDPSIPLVVALVELEEGPRMMSNVVDVGSDPTKLALDMPLTVKFVQRGDVKLPVFAPAGREA